MPVIKGRLAAYLHCWLEPGGNFFAILFWFYKIAPHRESEISPFHQKQRQVQLVEFHI